MGYSSYSLDWPHESKRKSADLYNAPIATSSSTAGVLRVKGYFLKLRPQGLGEEPPQNCEMGTSKGSRLGTEVPFWSTVGGPLSSTTLS